MPKFTVHLTRQWCYYETTTVEDIEADTPEQAAERERKREGARFGRKLDKAYRQRAEAQAQAEVLRKQLLFLVEVIFASLFIHKLSESARGTRCCLLTWSIRTSSLGPSYFLTSSVASYSFGSPRKHMNEP